MSKSARNRAQRTQKNVLTKREVPWGSIAFFTVIGLVAVVAIGWAFVQSRPASAAIEGLIEKDGLGQEHTSGTVRYETTPPMGGDHDPAWQNCDARVYDSRLRNENAVHSLEHGAVWITYQPGLAAAQVDKLGGKVKNTDYTMMSPYPGQDSPIILTAWGKQLKLQDASDPRVDVFLRSFVKGPQTLEPGAACSGAKDTP
ncbi:DUF3105 domain-containing protein [Actinomadura sp. 9N407]|uniref:DUF3105 domain-containing protein n=1 Tax=Actinomadura sp. 9N407 TaxID=3375154 RepID=UPI003789AF58